MDTNRPPFTRERHIPVSYIRIRLDLIEESQRQNVRLDSLCHAISAHHHASSAARTLQTAVPGGRSCHHRQHSLSKSPSSERDISMHVLTLSHATGSCDFAMQGA